MSGKNINKKVQGSDNREWGHEAEQIAADYYLKKGYTIRERNWRMGHLEIDIILEKDRTIVFAEVKARKPGNQDPIDAVNRGKQRRIINAADVYMRSLPMLYQYRFDIIAFTGDRDNYEMEHFADAFLPSVNGGRR